MKQILALNSDMLKSSIDEVLSFPNRRVLIYFSGSTDLDKGDSWSADCCQCNLIKFVFIMKIFIITKC